MEERFPWLIIDKYFNDNPNYLVAHHLDSYNSFYNEGLSRIFKEKNPIKVKAVHSEPPPTSTESSKAKFQWGDENDTVGEKD